MIDMQPWKESFKAVFPAALFEEVKRCEHERRLEEIRVRVNRPVQYVLWGEERLSEFVTDEKCCDRLFENICEHSVYAREDELKNCFITLAGGYRVGICGKAVVENGTLQRLSRVTGFNLRIAREFIDCAKSAVKLMTDERGNPLSTLFIAAPGVGKTTLLRDIARQFSYGLNGLAPKKVCIADERSEIAGARLGIPMLDVGPRTDVMDGCPKAQAMRMLIRTLSPELIITDEIGGEEDARAIADASSSGVAVVASAHAKTVEEARKRQSLAPLVNDGYFARLIELYRSGKDVVARPVA